ncbi:MAG TPA: hypothetical protein VD929_09900 [Caulobacteraceae bacterium]|nr:hypothetical protein [Caulobacteraceae bacterium]
MRTLAAAALLALALAAAPALAAPKRPSENIQAEREPRAKAKPQPAKPASAKLTAAALVGADGKEVERRLGEPETARAEGDGAMWTYRLKSCALHVFFRRPDAQGTLRVTGSAAGPLKRGEPVPAVDACLAGIEPS